MLCSEEENPSSSQVFGRVSLRNELVGQKVSGRGFEAHIWTPQEDGGSSCLPVLEVALFLHSPVAQRFLTCASVSGFGHCFPPCESPLVLAWVPGSFPFPVTVCCTVQPSSCWGHLGCGHCVGIMNRATVCLPRAPG